MSTKTTFKRVALGVVVALGLSVAPASAAVSATVATVTNSTVTVAVGQTAESTFSVATTAAADLDVITYSLAKTSSPAGSTMALAAPASTAAASEKFAFRTGSEAVVTGWTLATAGNTRTDTAGTTVTPSLGGVRGTISVTPSAAGTYVFTLTADASAGTDGSATFTVIATAQNAARNAFINESTTVDDAGAVFSATSLTAAKATPSSAPGVSFAANGAVASSVASMTVPLSAVIAFKVTGSADWSTGSKARLSMNGSTVAELACTIATVTCTLANYTAPATAGTYSAVLTMSGANASFDPALTESISFTITVGSAASGQADFGDTSATSALQVTSVGVSRVSASGRVGVPVSFAPTFTVRNGTGGSLDSNTKAARLLYTLTLPAGTAGSLVTAAVAGVATTSQTVTGKTETLATTVSNATPTVGTITYFIPATAGTYTVTVIHDADRDGLVDAYEATSQSTFVIAADGVPTITFTQFGSVGEAVGADDEVGKLVKISLRNGTAAATLASNETLTLTGTGAVFDYVSTVNAAGVQSMSNINTATTISLTASAFNGLGDAYVNVYGSTYGTITVSATVAGGTASGASGSFNFTVLRDKTATVVKTPADVPAAYSNENALLGVYAAADRDLRVKRGTSTAVKVGFLPGAAASAKSYYAKVTDTEGLITGLKGAEYTMYTTTSDTAALVTATTVASFSVTIPSTTSLLASGTAIATLSTLKTDAGVVEDAIVIKAENALPKYAYSNPAGDAASYTIRAGSATTNTFTVTSTDQFGNALAGIGFTGAIVGRNSLTVLPTYVSDVNGQFKVTLADTYTGTILLTDQITLTPTTGTGNAVININYATYNPVTTITLTTPDSATATATGIAGTVKTDISSLDGAEEGAVAVKAVLKDANGGTLPAGIAVNWTISGNTGAAITSTTVSGVTDTDGSVSAMVYGWKNGNATVTATAGTITASGIVYFEQAACTPGAACAEARTITAKAEGNVVTASVTDRFGNPIKGVNVVASRVGTGTFDGTSTKTASTDKTGTVQFVLSNGTADVTVSFETPTFGASAASKGYADAGITALTAYTVGTVSLDEEGVGASFDAAGINSAVASGISDSTTQSAADSAAEATDAANAATDAANAAAEAADAATAAAQDAADAVAALSTQVSEMVNALKKQITALTNLVIKIQKKVKA